MWYNESMNFLEKFLSRNIETINTPEELAKKLGRRAPLRLKLGVDITSADLHLGHAVVLWKMRELQEQGHKVVFLIGDFTSLVGDPTGKDKTRPEVNPEDIERDAKTYLEQVHKILLSDPAVFEVRRNSEWWHKMTLSRFVKILGQTTHGKLIARDFFQRRIEKGEEIYMHELIYPILQGYDSVELKSDVAFGATDQLFNEMLARPYQVNAGQEPQVVITTPALPGLDGVQKMSKSLGNYIALNDTPKNMFGKVMSIPDSSIITYFTLATAVPSEEIQLKANELRAEKINPRDLKMELARAIISRYYSASDAESAQAEFIKVFSKKERPSDMPVWRGAKGEGVVKIMVEGAGISSNTEARRLIAHKAVEFNGTPITDDKTKISENGTLKIGKLKWVQVNVE